MESIEETKRRLLATKNLPSQSEKFKTGDKVKTPIGTMYVVCLHYKTLVDNVWIPQFKLGYLKKDGTLNKKKRFVTYSQNEIEHENSNV